MKIKLTPQQCEELYSFRNLPNKKALKKEFFARIKRTLGLNNSSLGVRNIIYQNKDNYGVLYSKRTDVDLDDGLPEPAVKAKPVAAKTASKPVTTPVKPTPQPAAKKAPVAVSKPVAKPVAKPVVKASSNLVMGISGTSKVKTEACQVEMRFTINGVRSRYGFAKDEATKNKVFNALKKASEL